MPRIKERCNGLGAYGSAKPSLWRRAGVICGLSAAKPRNPGFIATVAFGAALRLPSENSRARASFHEVAIIAQIFKKFVAALVAILRFFRQRAHHRSADARMNRGIDRARRHRHFVHDFVDDRRDALAGKWFFSSDHFVQHDAERKNIGATIDGATLHLFRRHVARRAHHVRGLLHGSELQNFRGAEVGDFHRVVAGQHDVRRLDVAMHDVVFVRKLQRVARLLHDAQHARKRKRVAGIEQRLNALAFNQFHRDVEEPVFFAGVVHDHDVVMRQQVQPRALPFESERSIPNASVPCLAR